MAEPELSCKIELKVTISFTNEIDYKEFKTIMQSAKDSIIAQKIVQSLK